MHSKTQGKKCKSIKWYKNLTIEEDGVKWIKHHVYLYRKGLKRLTLKDYYIDGVFSVSHNQLKNLKGSPRYVKDDFFCNYNPLESLEGAPEYIGGELRLISSPVDSLYGLRNTQIDGTICIHKPSEELKKCPYYIQFCLMDKIVIFNW